MKQAKKSEGLRISDNSAEKIGDIICQAIENVKGDWKKPWLSVGMEAPKAFGTNRYYNSINAFLLTMLVQMEGYKTSQFITMHRVNELEINIKQKEVTDEETGEKKMVYEKPFPVFFFQMSYYKSGEGYITPDKYVELDEKERDEWDMRWAFKVYHVFNLDQTTYEEKYPEKYAKLIPNKEDVNHVEDVRDEVLDAEIEQGMWRCPITQTDEGRACYYPKNDKIMLPKRQSFFTAHSFYGTALHEMTHSTMKELKREYSNCGFGSTGYAKEELVAELTSAIFMNDLGLEKVIDDEHLQYLKHWQSVLKDKDAVRKVLDDVMSALSYHKKQYNNTQDKLNKQKSA